MSTTVDPGANRSALPADAARSSSAEDQPIWDRGIEDLSDESRAAVAPTVVGDAASNAAPHRGGPRRIPRPATVRYQWIWYYVVAFVLYHALALLAFHPYFFSWTGVISVFVGNYIFCSTGIGLCYHRTLTHRGLIMPKWLERTLAILGLCSLQDAPARWVAIHRMHHQFSDEQPDPHSPMAGFLWGHLEWLIWDNTATSTWVMYEKYAKDILRDPVYYWLERGFNWVWVYLAHVVLFVGLFFGIGYAYGGWEEAVRFGYSMFIWGVVVRTLYTWHVTWAVNSVAHVAGYRNYETSDNSRNNWFVAWNTGGEGWHNNHHAYPRAANHGHRWWEFDLTYRTIRLLEWLGLAREVHVHHPKP